ncbi:hypothetical protein [Sporomusa acidovorans]|uniref:Uncharacterized protein n=1 Tax=Sporomusa acidovorans (strain ATCC 49682 / DSM 3132 / Mol) TaxID=1123286 RepID=A0ABZ3J8B2_SPOA4|nr:hypothetical protein [Sporomusa acidovorans]OZC16034.1 hypothetical protein SPACI_44000 [Sporomusa acidovorans DSM 3132]SDD89015.1 hypothetical protein SAMN04488499_100597 [Sporomusa acidovorans]
MLSILRLTLRNKQQYDFRTDSRVAEAIAMHHQDGGVFYSIEGREGLSVDFKSVIAVQIMPFQAASKIPVAGPPSAVDEPLPGRREPAGDKPEPLTYNPTLPPEPDQEAPKELYKIECKCGAEYFCRLFSNTTKCRCRECNDTVFVDKFTPKRIGDNNQPATLVTNRYRVHFIEGDN